MKFGKEDIDAGKIEIAEMYIFVRYLLQPRHEVFGLGIARNEQQTPGTNGLCEQLTLLTYFSASHRRKSARLVMLRMFLGVMSISYFYVYNDAFLRIAKTMSTDGDFSIAFSV